MSTRLNWVPTHSVIVVRDGKQVDAFEATSRGTKAFKFTADEVTEIHSMSADALREPVEETVDVTDDDVKLVAAPVAPTPEKPAVVVPEAKKTAVKDVKL